jgi:hypothetical protein
MTQADNSRPKFSDEQLNFLYNACDVGINTTTGEGWGMPSFEHAATRAAQIVPHHTSLADLWKGVLIPLERDRGALAAIVRRNVRRLNRVKDPGPE